jgi:hypothetical protein
VNSIFRYIDTRIFGVQHILHYGTRHSRVQPMTYKIDTTRFYVHSEH